MPALLHDWPLLAAERHPDACLLRFRGAAVSATELVGLIRGAAAQFRELGLRRGDRVAVFLPKQTETVSALLATSHAGGVFVPINPVLKAEQVRHILDDCAVRILVTSASRLESLRQIVPDCPALRAIVLVDALPETPAPAGPALALLNRDGRVASEPARLIETDVAAILYTSGSTGRPKGVVLSHRNLTCGAESVAEYLQIDASDRLLAVLPFSFDYGLNQLTTSLLRGACCVLMDFLLPRDVVTTVARERITGLAAVPPLWVRLARLDWPEGVGEHLRYLTNSGGKLPRPALAALRAALPTARLFLMYGLTEAFRSTYLPPEDIDQRPDSIGRAIPNAEVMVVRPDGSPCAADEPGELVHRGPLVSLGYWNSPDLTRQRFRPVPGQPAELAFPEIAVWSGDTVIRDAEGYLYFVGRADETIKTSGYRASPTEVEEVLARHDDVAEAVAFGVPHPLLGQAIVAVVAAQPERTLTAERILTWCRQQLPAYLVPLHVALEAELPRNPNGKFDRGGLAQRFAGLFAEAESA